MGALPIVDFFFFNVNRNHNERHFLLFMYVAYFPHLSSLFRNCIQALSRYRYLYTGFTRLSTYRRGSRNIICSMSISNSFFLWINLNSIYQEWNYNVLEMVFTLIYVLSVVICFAVSVMLTYHLYEIA